MMLVQCFRRFPKISMYFQTVAFFKENPSGTRPLTTEHDKPCKNSSAKTERISTVLFSKSPGRLKASKTEPGRSKRLLS